MRSTEYEQREDGLYIKRSRAQLRDDSMYMDIAYRIADESHDHRRRVGAVLVLDGTIISYGWNGTPPGDDNECTHYRLYNSTHGLRLVGESKPTVIHAEMNALAKVFRSSLSAKGATMYCTDQACQSCALHLGQAQIKELVYARPYRVLDGVQHLHRQGVFVRDISGKVFQP